MSKELLDKNKSREALGRIGNTKFYQILASGEFQACKISKRLMVRHIGKASWRFRMTISLSIEQLPKS